MREILKGVIDIHIHAGPSVAKREVDAADMLKLAEEAGYAGFLVKDHYFPSVLGTKMVEQHLGNGTCKVYGCIALNNSIGLFNLKAIDTARQMDARIVYFPTVSAANHINSHKGNSFAGAGKATVEETPVVYIDENGALVAEAVEVLKYMAEHDMVLGTGHGSIEEIRSLVDTAVKLGVKRILVNHPHYHIGATMDDIKHWANLGAYIEVNACVFKGESKYGVVENEYAEQMIRTCGVDKIIIDSDLGQAGNISPVEGLYQFIERLINDHGISEEEINIMTKTNPAKLLGI